MRPLVALPTILDVMKLIKRVKGGVPVTMDTLLPVGLRGPHGVAIPQNRGRLE